jgi:hypothetical protein
MGQGPMTGRGMGPCGGGRRGFGRGMGFCRFGSFRVADLSKEEEKKMIEEEIKYIEEHVKELKKQLE